MAYERISDKKDLGSTLDLFVEGAVAMYRRQLAARNADDEMNFNRLVLEENLSLDDQLLYRKDQLKRIGKDPEEKRRVIGEISGLTDRIEQKTFADNYLQKLVNFEAGITSVDSVINWLETTKANTTDMAIKNEIDKQLVAKNGERFEKTQSMIQAKTAYAVQDKTDSVITTQIGKVQTERTKALLAGQDSLVSVYDLQIQSLNKAKNEASIEKSIKDFAVNTVSGAMSATQLLDSYNSQIASATEGTPISIGGTTYSSAREFWSFRRDSYVSDASESGFFTRFNSERNMEIKVKNSQENLSAGDVAKESGMYDGLRGRTELQGYEFKIDTYKQDTIQNGSELLASDVRRKYSTGLDINKAFADLDKVKALGGNIESTYSDILLETAKIVDPQQQALSERMFEIADEKRRTGQPVNMNEIRQQAESEGIGKVYSPEELAQKPAGEIAEERVTQFTQPPTTAPTPDTRFTVKPTEPTTPPEPTPPLAIKSQLDYGAQGAEVESLQKFLVSQGHLTSEDMATGPGIFGPRTQKAVQSFQSAQGIVSTGDVKSTG